MKKNGHNHKINRRHDMCEWNVEKQQQKLKRKKYKKMFNIWHVFRK